MARTQRRRDTRSRRREKKNVPHGQAHIHASFNNTIITITDVQGNTLCWASAGCRSGCDLDCRHHAAAPQRLPAAQETPRIVFWLNARAGCALLHEVLHSGHLQEEIIGRWLRLDGATCFPTDELVGT